MERQAAKPHADPSRWVSQHGDYLYRFALARVRSHHATEEIVQETLLAALSARHQFAGHSSERTWLTAILKRKVCDWLRAAVRKRATQQPLPDSWSDEMFTPAGKWKAGPWAWPEDGPEREEFWEALAGCLGLLPERQRQAFVLLHIDGETARDVRRSLGASEGNLWVLLYRARMRLWRCLNERWFGEDGT
jgi:RNA polymerase sigma-70 factor (ECF subfamily)